MANPLLAGLLVAATLLPPHGQQDTVPTELRAAAAELELGRVDEAIKLAERYTLRHGRDPRGFMILGDAHAAHMPTGRFRALESYRQAKQLLPHDPEPPYRIAHMGLWLGGDDGERIDPEGFDRVMRSALRDSSDVLWRQVVGIATPNEIGAWWAGVPPEAKGAWLESFWARRNPNLFASTNHRIVEHFSRLRYARKRYPLLHPSS